MRKINDKMYVVHDDEQFVQASKMAFSAFDYERLTCERAVKAPDNITYPAFIVFHVAYAGYDHISFTVEDATEVEQIIRGVTR